MLSKTSPTFFVGLAVLVATETFAQAQVDRVIDFDCVGTGLVSGDFFSDNGISFASGSIPNDVSIGAEIEFVDRNNEVYILDENSVSPPNVVVAADFAMKGQSSLEDILMTLSQSTVQFSVDLDDSGNKGADIVRLLALEKTNGADRFMVVDIDEDFDNANPRTLTVKSMDTFSHAIFQVTTELEGFDNVTFRTDLDFLPGDVNQDGSVNLLDVAPFVGVITSGDFQKEADVNQDGVVDLLDVAPFVELLTCSGN